MWDASIEALQVLCGAISANSIGHFDLTVRLLLSEGEEKEKHTTKSPKKYFLKKWLSF
uniref:Succinate dehydrogenase subunit 7B-like isoform X1 n=1 Tax=Rhizophora mucronata TaxID=61149 RepID=A0A2P2IHN6_RHIMU